jgi:hypothetical protein
LSPQMIWMRATPQGRFWSSDSLKRVPRF